MKKCSKCGVSKKETEYPKDSRNKKSGLAGRCKVCDRSYYHEKKNTKEHKGLVSKYYNANKESILKYKKIWSAANDTKERKKARDDKSRSELQNGYVAKRLKRRGISAEQIKATPELLGVLKEVIKIKRLCQSKNQ